MKIRLNPNQQLTPELVKRIIALNSAEQARRDRLANYYRGQQNILYRSMGDSSKPNNKLIHTYGNYITDTITGYFMGQPVSYVPRDAADEAAVDMLREIFEYNDEQGQNVELAKESSKVGVSYELHYVDNDGNPRFKIIDNIQAIPVYDDTLEEELLYFIRYYNDDIFDLQRRTVEVISSTETTTYAYSGETMSIVDVKPHAYGMVPVSIYYNNAEELGDYELVVSLIDAYDKLASDAVNDFESFADAYLTLKGMDGTQPEDIAAMREQRVLLLPENGEAAWLVKAINDTYFQNTIANIDGNIHKFSKVPNLMDAAFGGNLSGIAIKYKLMGLENKVAVKESYFKRGLQRRIELISNIMRLFGNDMGYLGMDIVFKRNIPTNELEAAQLVQSIYGIVSDETALAQLPFVGDPTAEIEKKLSQFNLNDEAIINEETNEESN